MNPIDPEKYYTTHEIFQNGYFAWVKSMKTLTKWIKRDMEGQNVLATQTSGEGTGKRYLIKGENLIKFIAQFEDGSLSFEPKGNTNE